MSDEVDLTSWGYEASPGSLVAVHYGDYRLQEIWVASGANYGNWYPLGGEFWAVWDRQQMPTGVTKQHPTWEDVLARGPVTLLVDSQAASFNAGWHAGRRQLLEKVAELVDASEGPEDV